MYVIQAEDGNYRYFSYLLRAWQEAAGGSVIWVYEIECIQTGQKVTFQDLQRLYDYLKEREAI